jgi:hypothetical protein
VVRAKPSMRPPSICLCVAVHDWLTSIGWQWLGARWSRTYPPSTGLESTGCPSEPKRKPSAAGWPRRESHPK